MPDLPEITPGAYVLDAHALAEQSAQMLADIEATFKRRMNVITGTEV